VGDRRRRLVAWAARRLPRFGVPSPAGADPWAWLEPYPVAPGAGAQRSLSIAFVAALQRLPPDQRAALVLSDVLEFPLTEVADILDCDVTEVGHLLLRARAAIDVPAQACADGGREAEVVARFTGAFERGDIAAIVALLAQDAWLRMRPLPIAYRGRAAARYFLSVVAFPGGTPGYRLVGTRSRANGQPAFGCYLRDPAAAVDHACGLVMLTIGDDGRIAAIDRFTDNSMLSRFGLPRTLPAATELRGIQRRHVLQFRVAVTAHEINRRKTWRTLPDPRPALLAGENCRHSRVGAVDAGTATRGAGTRHAARGLGM
jgi:hypothetical protein